MASKGQVDAYLNALPSDQRKIFVQLFQYVLSWFALGTATKAENFAWYRIQGMTHATALTEFSVEHGMDTIPQTLIPVVDVTAVGSQLVPLSVSRAPDARRIYLKSTSTGAVFTAFLE